MSFADLKGVRCQIIGQGLLVISQKNELVGIMTITDVLDGLLYLLESHKGQMEEKISGF